MRKVGGVGWLGGWVGSCGEAVGCMLCTHVFGGPQRRLSKM